jgi:hypothetical protein
VPCDLLLHVQHRWVGGWVGSWVSLIVNKAASGAVQLCAIVDNSIPF